MTIIKKSEERWFEAEVNRIAGEIALMAPEPDAAKAQECFEQALAIARAQQAKSWELRAAMSMARLWRDQGKQDAARELLAPVYGWFTEGFDTLDLKEAKALLDNLRECYARAHACHGNVRSWHIVSFRCAAQFCHYGGMADEDTPQSGFMRTVLPSL